MALDVVAQYRELKQQLDSLARQVEQVQSEYSKNLSSAQASAAKAPPALVQEIAQIDKILNQIHVYVQFCGNAGGYAPTARDIPLKELQKLYVLADLNPKNKDALRQKALDAQLYYQRKKQSIELKIEQAKLSTLENAIAGPQAQKLKQRLEGLQNQYIQILTGEKMFRIIRSADHANTHFTIRGDDAKKLTLPQHSTDRFSLGFLTVPFPVPQVFEENMKKMPGGIWSANKLKLSVDFGGEKQEKGAYPVFHLRCLYQQADSIWEFLQGTVFNILRNYTPLQHRVYILDTETYNPEFLGSMQEFVGEHNLICFPRDESKAVSALKALESAAASEPESSRHRRYLILRGSFSGNLANLARKIQGNGPKNNVCVIWMERGNKIGFQEQNAIPFNLTLTQKNGTLVTDQGGEFLPLAGFGIPGTVNADTVKKVKKLFEPKKVSNSYESKFPLDPNVVYTRQRRDIRVPYALDTRHPGQYQELVFEKMNFAAFVMGASQSGKSTLLHTIITGIIQNYHPDEVELWLADFKETEFAPYARHMPPHVKYILMDHSPELIFDFLDRLEVELQRRQVLNRSLGINNRRSAPLEKYYPALFVIMDEFSTMSLAIKDNSAYKDKLEQLLVRGAALGMRFIFASQSYTDGAPALKSMARKSIGSRIALKNTPQEIRDTLDIPSSQLTDEIKQDIDTLPKYHTLHHWQDDDGVHHVDRSLVLYFDGQDAQSWAPRFQLIDSLRKRMKPVELKDYDPRKPEQYVDKHPVVVSSEELFVFSRPGFLKKAADFKKNPDNILFDGDVMVSFGNPRRLADDILPVITTESNENIFLLAGEKELACGASVVMSAARSFLAQGMNVQVWANPRNRMYHRFKDTHFRKLQVSEGTEAICTSISQAVDNIRQGKQGKDLIILMGMENVCIDLNSEAEDLFGVTAARKAIRLDHLVAVTDEEIAAAKKAASDETALSALLTQVEEKGEAYGWSEEKIDAEYARVQREFYRNEHGWAVTASSQPREEAERPRDHLKEFQALVRAGSRYGYRFLVCVNNLTALKAMGLNISSFNHRLAFRTDTGETSISIFGNSSAKNLSGHICQYAAYGSSSGSFSLVPYLHKGIVWDNWIVDEKGEPHNLGR